MVVVMQEDMGKLKSTVEEPDKPESAASLPLLLESKTHRSGTEREAKQVEQKNKEAIIIPEEEQEGDKAGGNALTTRAAKTEDKAAKIERLKSGFRICKPQGSFLWPSMIMSPQALVQLDDLVVVPTPPSVSSSSTPPPPHLLPPPPPPPPPPQQHEPLPTSPVKPLAGRNTVTVALSSPVTKHTPPPPPLESTTITTATAAKNSFINLNEVPSNQNENEIPESQSHSHTSVSPLTYQRRHNNVTPSTAMPRAKKVLSQWEGVRNEMKRYCEQQQRIGSSSSSCSSTGVGTWLALASPHSSLDNNCRRG